MDRRWGVAGRFALHHDRVHGVCADRAHPLITTVPASTTSAHGHVTAVPRRLPVSRVVVVHGVPAQILGAGHRDVEVGAGAVAVDCGGRWRHGDVLVDVAGWCVDVLVSVGGGGRRAGRRRGHVLQAAGHGAAGRRREVVQVIIGDDMAARWGWRNMLFL